MRVGKTAPWIIVVACGARSQLDGARADASDDASVDARADAIEAAIVDVVVPPLTFKQISAGSCFTCAVTTSGAAFCWGFNGDGELGSGSTEQNSFAPIAVVGLESGVESISAGFEHSCAVQSGDAFCWGDNVYGALGNNAPSVTHSLTPIAVASLSNGVTAISAGEGYTCAVRAGSASCWGVNQCGQLGAGTVTIPESYVPIDVLDLTNVTSISVNGPSCAITSTSTNASCWGCNPYGDLGDGTTINRSSPASVVGLDATAIAAGAFHVCAITSAGAAVCWGDNQWGELGNGSNANSSTPVAVVGLTSGVVAISAGYTHTCALTAAGAVVCWGSNEYGELGNASNVQSSVPVAVTGLSSNVTSLGTSGPATHVCAITSDGVAMCWGNNQCGQLGDGSMTNSAIPVKVTSPR